MPRQRKVILLGSTGSIGKSTLEVARQLPDNIRIVGLAAHRSSDLLAQQARETGAAHLCLTDPDAAKNASDLPAHTTLHTGPQGLIDMISLSGADMAIIAIVGTAGLQPALHALELGMDLAVASKEILVLAGKIVMEKAREKGVIILPVDSEHNAIFQCLEHRNPADINRLILTASGGPFRTWPEDKIRAATRSEALNHPTWSMGDKITIDSATLFNKGLEMIEARWLFDVPMDRIDVIVHPQSIIHSMVEFLDHSVLAQLSHNDMCFSIQYAVTWPERIPTQLPPLDFAKIAQLTFEAPRDNVFPALRLAREVGTLGGTHPAVFNAANEIAVAAFLREQIPFPRIAAIVEETLQRHDGAASPNLDALMAADAWARQEAASQL